MNSIASVVILFLFSALHSMERPAVTFEHVMELNACDQQLYIEGSAGLRFVDNKPSQVTKFSLERNAPLGYGAALIAAIRTINPDIEIPVEYLQQNNTGKVPTHIITRKYSICAFMNSTKKVGESHYSTNPDDITQGKLDLLLVNPKWHNNGIGTELFNYTMQCAQRVGINVMTWYASPITGLMKPPSEDLMQKLVRWYEKRGAHATGPTQTFPVHGTPMLMDLTKLPFVPESSPQ